MVPTGLFQQLCGLEVKSAPPHIRCGGQLVPRSLDGCSLEGNLGAWRKFEAVFKERVIRSMEGCQYDWNISARLPWGASWLVKGLGFSSVLCRGFLLEPTASAADCYGFVHSGLTCELRRVPFPCFEGTKERWRRVKDRTWSQAQELTGMCGSGDLDFSECWTVWFAMIAMLISADKRSWDPGLPSGSVHYAVSSSSSKLNLCQI